MSSELLHDAWDIHLHSGPDVVPRADDTVSLAKAARAAGMAGLLLKDHNGCSVGQAYTLNRVQPSSTRFYGALALNPAVGGLNPVAVEAALRQGASIVYLPTVAARHHLSAVGLPAPGTGIVVMPRQDFDGYVLFDDAGELLPELDEIIELIREHDAILGTGHVSPNEAIAVCARAKEMGLPRFIATHVSLGGACGFSVEQQRELVATGAWIEQSFLAVSPAMGDAAIPLDEMARQIRAIGCERVILSTDFGQVANGPIVEAFARHLERLRDEEGFSVGEIRQMVVRNPARLFAGVNEARMPVA